LALYKSSAYSHSMSSPGFYLRVQFIIFPAMITLGIETSCDETSCGIVNDRLDVLANEVYQQEEQHKKYGGVVPEIASRAHLEKISSVVDAAIRTSGIDTGDL